MNDEHKEDEEPGAGTAFTLLLQERALWDKWI
jgi:hypothetical protein